MRFMVVRRRRRWGGREAAAASPAVLGTSFVVVVARELRGERSEFSPMACSLPTQPILKDALAALRIADVGNLAKAEIDPAAVRALDGGGCRASTRDGVATGLDDKCVDLGEPWTEGAAPDGSHSHTPLTFLPPTATLGAAVPELAKHASQLRAAVERRQFPSEMCANVALYLHTLPQVGFGSVIEYAIMFLGRALTLDAQLRLGADSSRAWTSAWHCGPERSLSCYFNLSACCAALTVGSGRPLELPRRRDPINVAARGFNQYGSAWVSAQMVAYLWQRLTPHTRRAIEARRSATMSVAALPAPAVSVGRGSQRMLTIGMHIRRGDSCHKFRYCPANLTSSYFAAAARLRHVYGPSRLLLATDDAEAARLCMSKAMGFE